MIEFQKCFAIRTPSDGFQQPVIKTISTKVPHLSVMVQVCSAEFLTKQTNSNIIIVSKCISRLTNIHTTPIPYRIYPAKCFVYTTPAAGSSLSRSPGKKKFLLFYYFDEAKEGKRQKVKMKNASITLENSSTNCNQKGICIPISPSYVVCNVYNIKGIESSDFKLAT
jgi:hypothetical protein